MKQSIFITAIFSMALLLGACSDTDNAMTTSSFVEATAISEGEAFSRFMSTVDDISAQYATNNIGAPAVSRVKGSGKGGVNQERNIALADAAGRLAGGYIGSKIGVYAGTGFYGGGALAGYFIGRFVGGEIGAALASRAAGKKSEGKKKPSNFAAPVAPSLSDSVAYYIPDGATLEDSLGYIHNQLMAKMKANEDKYIVDGEIDYGRLYDRCVEWAAQYGCGNDTLTGDSAFKANLTANVETIANRAEQVFNGEITTEEYENGNILQFQQLGISENAVVVFRDYATKVLDTCSNLTVEQQQHYAVELDNALRMATELPDELRSEIKVTTNITINSSLCTSTLK